MKRYYTIGIDGMGANIAPYPMTEAEVLQWLLACGCVDLCLGVETVGELERLHRLLLTSTPEGFEDRLARLTADIEAGRVVVWQRTEEGVFGSAPSLV